MKDIILPILSFLKCIFWGLLAVLFLVMIVSFLSKAYVVGFVMLFLIVVLFAIFIAFKIYEYLANFTAED